MIENIRLQRTDGNIARVGLAVGLDFVRLAANEQRPELEVPDCLGKTPHGDVTMSAMAIQARVVGMFADAVGEDADRFAITAEVCGAASEPDDRVGAVRIRIEVA